MGRGPRYAPADGYYHVTSRGNNKGLIFLDDTDRRIFLELLDRFARRHGWVVIAYCLMPNHYHLVVYLPSGGLSAGMQLLNSGYACRFNRRHDRIDHVFRQRFTCTPIESEAHLAEACRYTVLNPVRAGLCASPEDWPWSSYRASVGLDLPHPCLHDTVLLRLFGRRPEKARQAFREFVAQGHVPVSDTGFKGATTRAG